MTMAMSTISIPVLLHVGPYHGAGQRWGTMGHRREVKSCFRL